MYFKRLRLRHSGTCIAFSGERNSVEAKSQEEAGHVGSQDGDGAASIVRDGRGAAGGGVESAAQRLCNEVRRPHPLSLLPGLSGHPVVPCGVTSARCSNRAASSRMDGPEIGP